MNITKVKYEIEPVLQPHADGHKFKLIDKFRLWINGILLEIPEGFWTDLASTGIVSPLNETLKPAITHDYLYYKQELFGKPISKSDADLVFLMGMKVCKFNIVKRRLYYWGVKYTFTARKTWNKYKSDREAKK